MKFAFFLLFVLTCATAKPCNKNIKHTRCGPAELRYESELIECHGIVTTCAEWTTLKTRHVNGAFEISIVLDGQVLSLEKKINPTDMHMAVGLAAFCKKSQTHGIPADGYKI